MDQLMYVIFICIVIPLTMSLLFLEKKSRLFIEFMIIGAVVCTFCAQINTMLKSLTGESMYYVTTNLTPICEEFFKMLPVLLFAYTFSDDRQTVISVSMAIGIGFAVIENILIFSQNGATLSVSWAIKRVFGASLMHGICTSAVGYGISFVRKRKKLFYTGTFALLVSATVYHSVFNSLIQSDYSVLGVLMPLLTYIPIVIKQVLEHEKGNSKVSE